MLSWSRRIEQEDHAKCASLKTGIVEKVIVGKDGEIRGAMVRDAGKGEHGCISFHFISFHFNFHSLFTLTPSAKAIFQGAVKK